MCDYTRLRFDQDALVHSGDLTSAPGPHGSTEFVDIDLRAVRRVGGRYVLPVVFSYNDVPFDPIARAAPNIETLRLRSTRSLRSLGARERRR